MYVNVFLFHQHCPLIFVIQFVEAFHIGHSIPLITLYSLLKLSPVQVSPALPYSIQQSFLAGCCYSISAKVCNRITKRADSAHQF
ncbi:hypothetical protein GDO86_003072 [Hymenochirus boettgeri]|uniref:Uncharacterized protein n=1 Tax=Hymenochirus boettgeri TaxID=247094 RepID=A0A8T2K807_9PIPI|nr:hypothetical protein GDO86_003072 [Hymenochirus boettgeri]